MGGRGRRVDIAGSRLRVQAVQLLPSRLRCLAWITTLVFVGAIVAPPRSLGVESQDENQARCSVSGATKKAFQVCFLASTPLLAKPAQSAGAWRCLETPLLTLGRRAEPVGVLRDASCLGGFGRAEPLRRPVWVGMIEMRI